jgi:esterase
MELFFRKYGEGPPLIILHGLYGSSDNWVSVARSLADHYEVYLPDQRNHGRSPHHSEHTYFSLSSDLAEFMERQHIQRAVLIGHSMGGKVVMHFAHRYPDRVNALIVVDIAPKAYGELARLKSNTINHQLIIQSMMEVDFRNIHHREEVEQNLMEKLGTNRIVKFLMKNLKRNDDQTFTWTLNLPALNDHLDDILDGLNEQDFTRGRGVTGFPVLFVKGGDSDYITMDDYVDLIKVIFPFAELVTIPKTGHWLHAEEPELLIRNIRYFLEI